MPARECFEDPKGTGNCRNNCLGPSGPQVMAPNTIADSLGRRHRHQAVRSRPANHRAASSILSDTYIVLQVEYKIFVFQFYLHLHHMERTKTFFIGGEKN